MRTCTRFTSARKKRFLDALSRFGSVTQAAGITDVHRRTAYLNKDKDPGFAQAWEETRNRFADALEEEAHRRAVEGLEEPVFYQGKQVGTQRAYSDRLLMMLLRANRPGKYAERRDTHVAGPAGSLVLHIGMPAK